MGRYIIYGNEIVTNKPIPPSPPCRVYKISPRPYTMSHAARSK